MIYKNTFTNIIGLILIVGMIFYITRQRKETMETGQNAAEMCKKISSKAEEITAAMDGAANVISAGMSFLSPRNYKSGDNTSDNVVRNIINTDLSSEDITKINNSCLNSSVVVQSNVIDFTGCKYCETHPCNISNVSQSNVSTNKQTCTINAGISALLNKKNSIDAMALGQALQKAQDVMSGSNKASNQSCNIINTDMSSSSYIDSISSCSNAYSANQDNYLASCASVNNLIQKNVSDNFQQCMVESDVVNKTLLEAETKASATSTAEQLTTGISPFASLGSSLSCCIVSIALIGATYMFSQSDSGKELINKIPAK